MIYMEFIRTNMITLFHFETALLLFLYLESPGPLNSENNLRTISDTFVLHPGFACAVFICIYVELIEIVCSSRWKWMTLTLTFLILCSILGVIVYGPEIYPNHLIFASAFFVSVLVLSTIRYLQYQNNNVQISVTYFSFFALLAVAYFWKEALGIVEIIYIYFVLNSWIRLEKPGYFESLTAKLYY
jgi:hypothetical protein